MTAAPVPFPAAARSLLRDTILSAVDQLARTRGWAATTMADVARAAGVSRQTVYNEFSSRPTLVEAYLAREVDSLVSAVDAAVRASGDDPHRALQEAFALFLRLASDEPVVQVIVSDSGEADLHRLLTGIGQSVATERIAALIPEVWPQVGVADARLLAETLVRLAISYALVPGQAADAVAADVARMLSSFVDEILAR